MDCSSFIYDIQKKLHFGNMLLLPLSLLDYGVVLNTALFVTVCMSWEVVIKAILEVSYEQRNESVLLLKMLTYQFITVPPPKKEVMFSLFVCFI